MWCIALWTAKLEKRGKRIKNAENVNKTPMVLEKRTSSEELSLVDPTNMI